MKVGIITMPLCANYGGTLQNWALHQVLKKMGHEPITLRFPVGYQGMSSIKYWVKVFPLQIARFVAHKFIGGKYEMPLTIGRWKRSVHGMEQFVDDNINVTEFLPNLSMDDVRRYEIEALIVGSDQIWRPVMYDAVKYYFLGFTGNNDIMRIAYAPSVALEEWPYNEETTKKLKELVKKFKALSVREETSVQLVVNNLGVEPKWVLDPTMLLVKEDYLKLCDNVPQILEPYIFAYILDMTDDKRIMAEQTAKALGCNVRYLSAGKVAQDDTIEKWLAYFRDSIYVITDSYHGAVFSLIFQKDFYCFYNKSRGKARMDSLIKITGLRDRFIDKPVGIDSTSIMYTSVFSSINIMRRKSLDFLNGSLG